MANQRRSEGLCCLGYRPCLTQCPPFSRRHFQMSFLEWKCVNFAKNLTKNLFPSVQSKHSNIGLDNGLAPNSQQAIIWTNAYMRHSNSMNYRRHPKACIYCKYSEQNWPCYNDVALYNFSTRRESLLDRPEWSLRGRPLRLGKHGPARILHELDSRPTGQHGRRDRRRRELRPHLFKWTSVERHGLWRHSKIYLWTVDS